jgi:DNA mismatch repair protein MutL
MLVSPLDKMPSSRNFQYFFVNKRPVSSRILQQALYKAYGERPSGKHPVCVALLELNADAFDVNVHPGKREIRFKKDGEMFEIISGLVGSALAKAKMASPITLAPAEELVTVEAAASASAPAAQPKVDSYYLGGRSFLPEEFKQLKLGPAIAMSAPEGAPAWYTPPFRYLGQIERSYMIFEANGGLFVMDQHAAAERHLYETLRKNHDASSIEKQRLLVPWIWEMPRALAAVASGHMEEFRKLGFEVEMFGDGALRVLAVPAQLDGAAKSQSLLQGLVEDLAEGLLNRDWESLLVRAACRGSVKANDMLKIPEMEKIISNLKTCDSPWTCPHGRPTFLRLSSRDLAKRFKRV